MTSNVIDISKPVRGSSSYARISDVMISSSDLTVLGQVLSRYGSLSDEAVGQLSGLKVKNLELKRNQKIYSICQLKTDVFIVRKGWVSLSGSAVNRGEDIYNVYMPGDIVGLRESFFKNHDITLLALQNCQLERVSVDDIHKLSEKYSEIKRSIVSYIMVNDNIAIERLRSCTHLRAEERVAHFLLEIYERYNFNQMNDSGLFYFPVTQEVVGELLGITNVHVSRCMTALEQKKLIRKSRSAIKLIEPESLAELTGFDRDLIYSHVDLT